MKKFIVEFTSPDGWSPTEEQLKMFIEQGLCVTGKDGGLPWARFIFTVKEDRSA